MSASLPHDRPQVERTRVHRRAWLAAGDRRRREIEVLHETGLDQFGGKGPSANGRDPLYARCSQLFERVDECVRTLDAFEPPDDPRWRDSVLKFTRQRIERHLHPEALARAVRVVPRSAAFDGLDRLAEIEVPVLVVGSRDEADPTHPLAVAEDYARMLPHARLVVEDEGDPPLAWQGTQLSRAIQEWLRETD